MQVNGILQYQKMKFQDINLEEIHLKKKKNMLNKFDFKKHKMQIENANRNMEKNRVNNALKAVTLHFVDVKSKLHLKDDDDLNILKEKIKRKQKKMHTKRNITNNYNDYRPKR